MKEADGLIIKTGSEIENEIIAQRIRQTSDFKTKLIERWVSIPSLKKKLIERRDSGEYSNVKYLSALDWMLSVIEEKL